MPLDLSQGKSDLALALFTCICIDILGIDIGSQEFCSIVCL